MNSAHRSSESAHRSGGPELKTEVFIVKTPYGQDAVIVSFVDDGEINGIYLYEPGADPVELDSVGIIGEASEFEHATVTVGQRVDSEGVRLSYGPANHHWKEVKYPGDGMVTRAERDAAVAAATEDHANLQQAYDTLHARAQALVTAVEHSHRTSHSGAFTWCVELLCQEANRTEVEL